MLRETKGRIGQHRAVNNNPHSEVFELGERIGRVRSGMALSRFVQEAARV